MIRLAIIIPTIGRDSLQATLDSVLAQTSSYDTVMLVNDSAKVMQGRAGVRTLNCCSETPSGHNAANFALDRLPTPITHSWRIDDDDVAAEGALNELRAAACEVPVFFKMRFGHNHPRNPVGSSVWSQPALGLGDIGTPCILAPRGNSRWGGEYTGDHAYAQDLVSEHGPAVWVDRVIAVINP